jgi:hypothetical protein
MTLISIFVVGGVLALVAWALVPKEKPEEAQQSVVVPAETPTALFMQTRLVGLPLRIAPGDVMHIVSLNKRRITSSSATAWGFYDVPNDSRDEREWPDQRVMKQAREAKNMGVFAWRADVSNHGPTTVIDIAIPLTLNFENDKPAVTYRAIVSPLAAGQMFTFYVVNDCNKGVSAVWPDEVSLLVLGEKERRKVPLRRTFKSPIDQVMVFMPSRTRLVGDAECE